MRFDGIASLRPAAEIRAGRCSYQQDTALVCGNCEQNGGNHIAGHIVDGRYIIRDASLLALIEAAYGGTRIRLRAAPRLDLDVFDVIAKVPAGTTQATADLMLQSLLAERFGLVARRETRPRFVLSVGPGGSKLKPATLKPAAAAATEQESGCKSQMAGMEGGRGGFRYQSGFGAQYQLPATTSTWRRLSRTSGRWRAAR